MRIPSGAAVRRTGLALALGAALLTPARSAEAQTGLAIDRFDPTPTGDDAFGVQSADVRGGLRLRVGVGLDLAHDALVLRSSTTGDEIGAVVGDQVWLRLAASLAIDDRYLLSLMVPAAILQRGDDPSDPVSGLSAQSPDGVELGDVRLGARVKLIDAGDAFALAVGAHLWLPTGNGDSYVSDEQVRAEPFAVVGGSADRFSWSAELGVLARKGGRLPGDAATPIGTAVTYGVAGGVLVDEARTLRIGPELYGESVVVRGGTLWSERSTTNELLGGARWRPGGGDWRLGLAAGPGFGHGAGTPEYRVVAGVDWAPEDPSEPPADRDGDGIADPEDACPDAAGVASSDPTAHGCPPPPDREVAPPPPADRDGDGIADLEDACPTVAGVANGDPPRHGCPPDSDGDGVVDPEDACPTVAGVAQPEPGTNGCPLAKLEQEQITISQRIEFDLDQATIRPESDPVLVEVAKILREHPEVERIGVHGHTDGTGSRAHNLALSGRRADAVAARLTELGVAKERLEARGLGADRPISDDATATGRAENRRVEFHVVRGPAAAQDGK